MAQGLSRADEAAVEGAVAEEDAIGERKKGRGTLLPSVNPVALVLWVLELMLVDGEAMGDAVVVGVAGGAAEPVPTPVSEYRLKPVLSLDAFGSQYVLDLIADDLYCF